jgi:hypothetical protein
MIHKKPDFSPLETSALLDSKQSADHKKQKDTSHLEKLNDEATSGKLEKIPETQAFPTKGKAEVKQENQVAKLSRTNSPLDRPGLFKDVPTTTRPCKCGSSKCLKLYCECFHSAVFCDPKLCRCKQCYNIEEYNSIREPKGPRVLAMLKVLSRKPRAFDGDGRKSTSATKGCKCKKSG